MAPVTVMIVDDHPLFRQGLRDVIETDPSLKVIAEAAEGKLALQLATLHLPRVILMDINLPTINGLQVAHLIKNAHPEIRIIMITGYDEAHQVVHALQTGASAYCPKDIVPETLIRIIHAVHAGHYVVGEKMMNSAELKAWLDHRRGISEWPETDIAKGDSPLSSREMEVLKLVAGGKSNKEIANALGISHQTVKNHMTGILRKLQVDDRTQATLYALQSGWVRLARSSR
jgi:DNA-binding NarL/FixJ family response regulator